MTPSSRAGPTSHSFLQALDQPVPKVATAVDETSQK